MQAAPVVPEVEHLIDNLIVDTYAEKCLAASFDGLQSQEGTLRFWACCLAPDGGLYVGDMSRHIILKVDAYGEATRYAGSGIGGNADGPRLEASFGDPAGFYLTHRNELLISDKRYHQIRLITSKEEVLTVAGTGVAGSDDGPCQFATFHAPTGVIEARTGILVADWLNNKIRLIRNGTVSTFAGSGTAGYLNGPCLSARFSHPTGLCLGDNGEIYVADRNNHCIRVIQTNGEVKLFAGTTVRGYKDGDNGSFTFPWSIIMSPMGDVIVADEYNHSVRVVSPQGRTSTLVGCGTKGYQNGSANQATFKFPCCVSLNSIGELFIADRDNYAIRRVQISEWFRRSIISTRCLTLAPLKTLDSLSDTILDIHRDQSWRINGSFLRVRCPALFDPVTQLALKSADYTLDAVSAMVEFIYTGFLEFLSPTKSIELAVRCIEAIFLPIYTTPRF